MDSIALSVFAGISQRSSETSGNTLPNFRDLLNSFLRLHEIRLSTVAEVLAPLAPRLCEDSRNRARGKQIRRTPSPEPVLRLYAHVATNRTAKKIWGTKCVPLQCTIAKIFEPRKRINPLVILGANFGLPRASWTFQKAKLRCKSSG